MRNLTTFVLVGTVLFATMAMAQSATDTNMEILKQKIKADKKLLVASNMDLTDGEAKQFWPLYDGYQKELGQITNGLRRRSRNTPRLTRKVRSRTTQRRSC